MHQNKRFFPISRKGTRSSVCVKKVRMTNAFQNPYKKVMFYWQIPVQLGQLQPFFLQFS